MTGRFRQLFIPYMLRPYQQNIKHNLFEAWRQYPSVMVQMPTGTGKTHLLASVISDRMMADDTASVWIVAHRRELVEQIEETVARYGISKDDGRVKPGLTGNCGCAIRMLRNSVRPLRPAG